MSWSSESHQISVGDDVYGSDGDKVGTVAEVQPSYIVVEKGFFFPTDYFIPMSAVSSVSPGHVTLNVVKDAALNSGWDTVPDADVVVVDTEPDSDTVLTTTATDISTTGRTSSGGQAEVGAYEVAAEDELRIPVVEEELTATVRPTEAGAVRIEKRVVEEDRVLEVPVTDEQIRVERRIVDRPVGAETQAFEEIVIDVPVTTEEVELQKQARVSEEIVVSKEATQRTERVTDTVRREEVYVDEDATIIDESEGGSAGRP